MSSKHLRTLVLNSNFAPVSLFPVYTIKAEDAITRCLEGKSYSILNYDRTILTPSRTDLQWPSVIVNRNSFTYNDEVKLKKETLFYRDHGRCVYCESQLTIQSLTYDHVLARSKGGKHKWENVVASCESCNQQKADLPATGLWRPKRTPHKPSFWQLLELRKLWPIAVDDEGWMEFLGDWQAPVIVRPPKLLRP